MSRTWVVLAAVMFCSPTGARAQQLVRTFDQLAFVLGTQDTLVVTDASGREFKGRLVAIDESRLRITFAEGTRVFEGAEVRRIQKRQADSMVNGLVIGATIGAAFAGTAWALVCSGEGCTGEAALIAGSLAFYGAAGAGVGALVDSLIRRKHTVYEAPARSAPASVSLAPMITPTSQRVLLSVRF